MLRVLHLHSSFGAGGKELRCVRLINAFGAHIAHDIVSAEPDNLAAGRGISSAIDVAYPADFPELSGRPGWMRLRTIAEAMRGYDLLLSYNWGAMDAVMAHRLFGRRLGLPPLVHHEDGFNADEADGLKARRNWYRRLALARSFALVVPSMRLENIARETWHQPAMRVHRIPNGIATSAYAREPAPDALPGLVKRPGDLWLGTMAGLRAVKDIPAMVRAFAPLPSAWQLVIAGEGPEREAVLNEAIQYGVEQRVHLAGFVRDPAAIAGLFDIFALSSRSEQFPISVVEAMAAGLPVAAPSVGDVIDMVSVENRPFIVPSSDEGALHKAFAALADAPELRRTIGEANRSRARELYDEARMIEAYRQLYSAAVGREFPLPD